MKNQNELIDNILGLLHSHREAHDGIYDDYLEGDSKILDAIMVEDKLFTENIEALKIDEDEVDEEAEVLDFLDENGFEFVLDHLNSKGYAFIKLDSLAHKMKLEDFIKAEIYPHYNDENKYSI